MRNFVLGALAAVCVFLAMGAARVIPAPAEASAVRKTFPLKLSDMTLDRAFRFTAPVGDSTTPLIVPLPSSGGLVITSVLGPAQVFFSINGAAPFLIQPTGGAYTGTAVEVLNPPIVVRPGDTVSIWTNTYAGYMATFAGYFVYSGEV